MVQQSSKTLCFLLFKWTFRNVIKSHVFSIVEKQILDWVFGTLTHAKIKVTKY